MVKSRRVIAGAAAIAGVVPLGLLVHPLVGSGLSCEGIGFGCTPERDMDTLFIEAVYVLSAAATSVFVSRRLRRGRRWHTALAVGIAATLLATGAATWSQLPRYPGSPGTLTAGRKAWERVLADGRAVAPRGTPLGEALRGLEREGPLVCRDAYGRSTGARELRWTNHEETNAYAGSSDSSGAATAVAVGAWGERLRRRGVDVTIADPDGDAASDRRLHVGRGGGAGGGSLSVRAAFYASELEITATTGCHRG